MSGLDMADRDSRLWWEAVARHELLLQRCAECGAARWPPRAICNRCGSLEWRWEQSAGRGTVASWIVNHHVFGPGTEPPYVVVLVRLDDQSDILMPGGWAGPRDGSGLAVGLPVVVGFQDVAGEDSGDGQGSALLRWSPA